MNGFLLKFDLNLAIFFILLFLCGFFNLFYPVRITCKEKKNIKCDILIRYRTYNFSNIQKMQIFESLFMKIRLLHYCLLKYFENR